MYLSTLNISLILSLLLFVITAAGQSGTVDVEYGKIISKLDYGKILRFKGSTLDKLQQPSDVVDMKVYTLSKKKYKECKEDKDCLAGAKLFYQNYWIKPSNDTVDSFNILMSEPLHFSERYLFVFSYYKSTTLSKDEIISSLSELAEDYVANNNLNVGDVNEKVVDEIMNSLKEKANWADKVYQIHPDLNDTGINGYELRLKDTELPGWLTNRNKDGLIYNLASKIVASSAKEKVDQRLEEIKTNLAITYGSSNQYDTNKKLDAIQAFLLRDSIAKKVIDGKITNVPAAKDGAYEDYIVEKVMAVRSFVNTRELTDSFLLDKGIELQRVLGEVSKDLGDKSLEGFYLSINRSISNYKRTKDRSDRFQGNIVDAEAAIVNKVDTFQNSYFLTGQQVDGFDFFSKRNLDSEKIKLDILTLGVGASWLSPGNDNSEWTPFGYIAARYYFYPIDKGLKSKPYVSKKAWYHRASAFLGFIPKATLSYQGDTLGKLNNINLQLVGGIGIDLNRFVTLDLGAVGFQQPNPHPFIDKSSTRFAPFISLNLNFDLVNRINKGITSNDYSTQF